MQGAEIERIIVLAEGTKVFETLSQLKNNLGMVECTCHPSYGEKHKIEVFQSKLI
jgi:hypothetical protein